MQKLKLKRLGVVQTANVMALLYVPIGVIYLGIGAAIFFFTADLSASLPLMVMGALFPLIGWVMMAFMTWLTNVALMITGGITLTFEAEE